VALLRTGVVLGREGGALGLMLPAFRLGLGGPLGGGSQYFPWIHLHDAVRIILVALEDARYEGPLNVVAPGETTNRGFARALGEAVGRPAVLPVPAAALRLLFGEASATMLASQRVRPNRLLELGFEFAHPTLAGALGDIVDERGLDVTPISTLPAAGSIAGAEYLHRHPPVFELRTRTVIDSPLEETFPFFSSAANLGLITPAALGFRLEGSPPSIRDGAAIDYRIRVGPVPLRWRTRIVRWDPPRRFADVQERGPYFSWWHEHTFEADGPRTVMDDRVCYAPPVPGALGRFVNRLIVAPMLRRIFAYRTDMIRLRFGSARAGV
jgi:ligand-binding SRPBCC domain-containing protein